MLNEIKVDKLPVSFHALYERFSSSRNTRFFDKLSWYSVVLFAYINRMSVYFSQIISIFKQSNTHTSAYR